MKFAISLATVVAVGLLNSTASAQCSTCAVPQVAYSPVVYNSYTTTYDGWYLGKYIGRLGRRVFGSAPAPAYAAAYPTTYAAAYPTTYAASYAPTVSYASYAPSCNTCGTSPCCCTQTAYRPVIMQASSDCCTCPSPCSTCNTCNTCSGVVQSSYDAPVTSSCPTCNTSAYVETRIEESAPSLPGGSPAPPQTFRETDRVDPIPADESSTQGQALDLEAPMLLDPNDKITKRPTAPVWTAVYKQPATITSVKSATRPATTQPKTIGWTSGR